MWGTRFEGRFVVNSQACPVKSNHDPTMSFGKPGVGVAYGPQLYRFLNHIRIRLSMLKYRMNYCDMTPRCSTTPAESLSFYTVPACQLPAL